MDYLILNFQSRKRSRHGLKSRVDVSMILKVTRVFELLFTDGRHLLELIALKWQKRDREKIYGVINFDWMATARR